MIIGTAYDVIIHIKICRNNENNERNNKNERISIFCKILLCFSVYTNTKLLFNTKEGPDTISVIHGLRFISIVWIILFHAQLVSKEDTCKNIFFFIQIYIDLVNKFLNQRVLLFI